ncbi:MAG: 30S ribosomal protein S8 [Candidatus Eisenbacteria bacterium]|uniref:Small ribosomal subunit protein uS8 n=1 Tax=Eiseniibacteriota bacterium TaxID=2212470 RepID=A0A7Y2E5L8_UNCEI|nr:30S ribosomal protein S8 [Candidatus Eisenbacteria bacterium]
MSVSDPIADMLTSIRNAINAGHRRVDIPSSGIKKNIAELLLKQRYIKNYKVLDEGVQGTIRVYLKFNEETGSVIRGIKRVSTPGRRVYVGKEDIPRVLRGLGVAIISTSEGLLTDREARDRGIGGEVLATIW